MSLPSEFLERLQGIVLEKDLSQVLAAFAAKRPTTLRANTLKISADDVFQKFTESGIELEKVPWWSTAFIVKNATLRQVTEHELYQSGSVYVQSLSSMIPPLVLDPQPNEKILDLTAAPGSKTTQIAALMKNTGEIIANDLSPVRLFKLQANVKMQGAKNVFVRRGPGEYFWKKFPEYFDRTLIDVPCSMEGRMNSNDPDTYEDWSLRKIKELSIRQCHLLRSAVSVTKVGGIIVYSTCTLAPEENENVVNWLLEREKGKVELEDISLEHVETSPAILAWQKKTFSPEVSKALRILPSSTMEGFFVAKLRKIAPTAPQFRLRHVR